MTKNRMVAQLLRGSVIRLAGRQEAVAAADEQVEPVVIVHVLVFLELQRLDDLLLARWCGTRLISSQPACATRR